MKTLVQELAILALSALSTAIPISLLVAATPAMADSNLPRPPQYVLLAFDGSLNLDFWQESYDFAQKSDVKFTYFISGVYFVMNQYKSEYTEPTHGIGRSAIGWGGTDAAKIRARVDWVNRAYDAGHEIGSHANGHYDGTKWTLENWRSEFKQFYHLIFDVFRFNKISESGANPFHFEPSEIKGFRAPLLGQGLPLYQVLRENNYAYDTSKTADMNYWPQKVNGIWNFPLAQVRIAGTGKRTLSMDYNFYFAQSNGLPKPENYALYKKQMLETYLAYFASNYQGNRAPVNIGHHFSKWNGGAYWDAMKEFASTVCSMPEVKCVTYRQYTDYVNSLSPSVIAQYQKGNFSRAGMTVPSQVLAAQDRTLKADVTVAAISPGSNLLLASLTGPQAQALGASPKTSYEWTLDGRPIAQTSIPAIDMKSALSKVASGSRVRVAVKYAGREVLAATHTVVYKNALATTLDWDQQLTKTALEDYALTPDPAEAHEGEPDSI